uniref:Uncharacterized protein n=1 Tax=Nelumbo nucifera TaxID=4432 RepID=A0A822ZCD9_NELNU|nr:TPA_asm: hypothetical protein HUJ06_001032 [Nelumbo nucifera]
MTREPFIAPKLNPTKSNKEQEIEMQDNHPALL